MTDRSNGVSRRALALGLAAAPAAIAATRAAAQPAASANSLPGSKPMSVRPFTSEGVFAPPQPGLQAFPLKDVRLAPGPFKDAETWNIGFMKRIDPERLLHTFRLTAGLPSSAKPLGGWEDPGCELRGHFTGHYMSASALAYASTGDAEMKRRGAALVAGLADCQKALNAGGYASAFPIEEFDRLGERRPVWAPFYTIHKIMAGLYDQHVHAENPQALPVLVGMATWVDGWTATRSQAHMQDILDTEFGGMAEVLYNLAAATGDARWMSVGDRFSKVRFLTPLSERRDELMGLHMNTHVPQVIGAARRYQLTGEPRFGQAANFFWDTVSGARTYATGGSSNREHWLSPPYQLADEWHQGADHQECCCAYNMMKLTRSLHQLTPQAHYMDYYERNLFNHRLGTIQPQTGRTGYFLSMSPGAWKTLATDDDTFWCCTGTGIEEFSKLADTVYAHDGRTLFVNLFVASDLNWPERGVKLEQRTRSPDEAKTTLVVRQAPGDVWPIALRIPGWTTAEARVLVNGRPLDTLAEPGGYLQIRRAWRAGDRIELETPMPLRVESFPDEPATQAFLAGPIVLAGQFPRGDLPETLVVNRQGPDVGRARLEVPPLKAGGRPAVELLQPVAGQPLTYTAATAKGEVTLKPLNQSWERFAVYWSVV